MEYLSLPNSKTTDADIVILPISYEDSVCAKAGTKDAPKAILEVSEQMEYYEEDLEWSPFKYMDICVEDMIVRLQNESIKSFKNKIRNEVSRIISGKNKLLISLGGEHSITPFITSKAMDKKGTVVFLDAHADLRKSYQGHKYSHATPAYHLLKQNHKLVMVGIRSIFESEAELIKSNKNITFFSDQKLRKSKIRKDLLKHISSLKGDVYCSIDMDVFNPAYVPSVGTPQPGGMDWYLALDILKKLFFNKNINIKGVDIVELIPEPSNVSQVFGAKLIHKIVSYWGKARGYDKKKARGVQSRIEYE